MPNNEQIYITLYKYTGIILCFTNSIAELNHTPMTNFESIQLKTSTSDIVSLEDSFLIMMSTAFKYYFLNNTGFLELASLKGTLQKLVFRYLRNY